MKNLSKNLQQSTFTIVSSYDLSEGKTRQITRIPSPPLALRKTFFVCSAVEVTCGLRAGAGAEY